jgi:hypothetical protein
MNEPSQAVTPREFALLLLAGEAGPRQRARDQQADRAGLSLKRRILEELLAIDPAPEELEAALCDIVERFGPPYGVTRAVAIGLLDEWRMMQSAPQWAAHLLDAAVQSREQEPRRGRKLPG